MFCEMQRSAGSLLHLREMRRRQQPVAGQQAAQVRPELQALARAQLPRRLPRPPPLISVCECMYACTTPRAASSALKQQQLA